MSARKRDNTPPFEIMGGRSGGSQPSGRGPRPGGARGAGGGGKVGDMVRSVIDTWQASANEPITLRVPRGMALTLLAGLLGLVLLSYWVGYSRGGSAAEKRVTAMYEPDGSDIDRTPPGGMPGTGGVNHPGAGKAGSGSATSGDTSGGDPRRPGLNYLILATYPKPEAQRLRVFMEGHGVEVMVGMRNNKGLCQVIALKGFTSAQYKAGLATEFRTEMLSLGRAWKAENKGLGDDLNTMYYDKYEPPKL